MDRCAVSPHVECLHLPAQARYQNPTVGSASNVEDALWRLRVQGGYPVGVAAERLLDLRKLDRQG